MGSACNSRLMEQSHVLKSMGLSKKKADCSIRISFGSPTTQSQLDTLRHVEVDLVNLKESEQRLKDTILSLEAQVKKYYFFFLSLFFLYVEI